MRIKLFVESLLNNRSSIKAEYDYYMKEYATNPIKENLEKMREAYKRLINVEAELRKAK
jgi:hypothetical protein